MTPLDEVIRLAIVAHWNGEDDGAPLHETIEQAVRLHFDVTPRLEWADMGGQVEPVLHGVPV